MSKFRKKPVVIEAVEFNEDNMEEVSAFVGEHCQPYQDGTLCIATKEGDMRANLGDWIIKGVEGEFYPCKPSVFHATYDPVSAS